MSEKSSRSQKINTTIRAADNLSLGISMVVAIAIGFGIGYFLKSLTQSNLALWAGILLGILAAINNVYKAYKAQVKSYDELKDKKYKSPTKDDFDREDDEI